MHSSYRDSLIKLLKLSNGRYRLNASLSERTWFRVGGKAEAIFYPSAISDLSHFLAAAFLDIPVTIIGVGSNLLVRDGGIPGVVIRLGSGFAKILINREKSCIFCGAAALSSTVSMAAAGAGIGGLEFLSGIPGTIGGALRMNAGAYGTEIKDVLVEAEALDRQGVLHVLNTINTKFSYRYTAVPANWAFTSVILKGYREKTSTIVARISEMRCYREKTQPILVRTGGSTFKNPEKVRAWELIDQAGCRGLCHGGAMISTKHCNFLVNTGNATATDLEMLGEIVRQRVQEVTSIKLEWEVHRVGKFAPYRLSTMPLSS